MLQAARKKIAGYRGRGPVALAERTPLEYLAGLFAAAEKEMPVALINPRWGIAECAQAAAQIDPEIWLGPKPRYWPAPGKVPRFEAKSWHGTLWIPTGGTSGQVRWAVHTWKTLAAAACALIEFLEIPGAVHVSTLPPWHVSGLMPAVRARETGGKLGLEDWKRLESGFVPAIAPEQAVISLVPTQLARLLSEKKLVRWLAGTRAILLGGAAPPPELLAAARQLRLPIALAYGMTETAAVVAAQRPADFLAGEPPWATPLPHAKIWTDKTGRLNIRAASLFQGYYPAKRPGRNFATGDFGEVDARGRVRPLGRIDRVIITGGEKVNPEEVEREIRQARLVQEVRVIGCPDAEWGERVVALYVGPKRTDQEFRQALRGRLAAYALPKAWVKVRELPKGKKAV